MIKTFDITRSLSISWKRRVLVRRWFLALGLAISICMAAPPVSMAADAHIVDVVRETGSGGGLKVAATLKGGFTPEIKEIISSGAPLTFTYVIQLKRIRALIWNKTEREIVVKKMVKIDALKKEYLTWEKKGNDEDDIGFEAELESIKPVEEAKNKKPEPEPADKAEAPLVFSPVILKKKADLEKWMTSLDGVELGILEKEAKPGLYYMRVLCKMKTTKLIPPFNYILFFVSFLDFDTDWTRSTTFAFGRPGKGAGKTGPPPEKPQPVK